MVAVVMGYEYPFDIFKCQTYRFEPFGYSRHIDPASISMPPLRVPRYAQLPLLPLPKLTRSSDPRSTG